MKLYEITIKPTSGFGTVLKGDTIFGHFCWQAANDAGDENVILNQGIKFTDLIKAYPEQPFIIFSSAYPKLSSPMQYILKKPDLPLHKMFSYEKYGNDYLKIQTAKKENKKNRWMIVDKKLTIDLSNMILCNDEFTKVHKQSHNTINRITNTTGTDMFAPYISKNFFYNPGIKLALFVLIDEKVVEIEKVCKAMMNIGEYGYGKDASTGMGKFEVVSNTPVDVKPDDDHNAAYTLAPSAPQNKDYDEYWFSPFTRFGKHGERLASMRKPFKKPVIMADEGAVFQYKEKPFPDKPYIGSAITNVSSSLRETVVQGYSPYIPFKLEL